MAIPYMAALALSIRLPIKEVELVTYTYLISFSTVPIFVAFLI